MTTLDLVVGLVLIAFGIGVEHMRIRFITRRKRIRRRQGMGFAR
jgi:hypothetical protein